MYVLDILGGMILLGFVGVGALQEGAVKPPIDMETVLLSLVGLLVLIVGWFVRNTLMEQREHGKKLSERFGLLSDRVAKMEGRMEAED